MDNDKFIKRAAVNGSIDLFKYVFDELKITFNQKVLDDLLQHSLNQDQLLIFKYLIDKGADINKLDMRSSILKVLDENKEGILNILLKYAKLSEETVYNFITDSIYDNKFNIFKELMEYSIATFSKDFNKTLIKRLFPRIWHKIKYVSDQTMVYFSYINSLDKDFYPNYKIEHKEEIENPINIELREKIRKIDKYLKEENQI